MYDPLGRQRNKNINRALFGLDEIVSILITLLSFSAYKYDVHCVEKDDRAREKEKAENKI